MQLLKTPLHGMHIKLGANMTEFAGHDMPLQYKGVLAEHNAVRNAAGLFDISHMGRFLIEGENSEQFIEKICTNRVKGMPLGRMRYSLVCNQNGGILDDVLIYKKDADKFLLVVNASNRRKIADHINANLFENMHFTDDSAQTGHIALQGPESENILKQLTKSEDIPIKYYTFTDNVTVAGRTCLVSRNGYTGEDGFEIICKNEDAEHIYSAFAELGAEPCGLGARDTLRFEASMPLYGHELGEDITPFQADLGSFVKLDHDFIGRDALSVENINGAKRKRTGLELIEKGIPRQGYAVYCNNERAGEVTSGGYCPAIDKYCAMAYIDSKYLDADEFLIEIRQKMVPCKKVALPFYKRSKK